MKETEKRKTRLLHEVIFFAVGGVLGTLLLFLCLWWISRDSILPGVTIAGRSAGGKSQAEATQMLEEEIGQYTLLIDFGGGRWLLPTATYRIEIPLAIMQAQEVGKKWDPQTFSTLLTGTVNIPLEILLDAEEYASFAAEINSAVSIVAQPASLGYDGKQITYMNGEDGIMLDSEKMKGEILKRLTALDSSPIAAPTLIQSAALSATQSEAVKALATQLIGKELSIVIEDEKIRLTTKELVSFLSLEPQKAGSIDLKTIEAYTKGLSERFNSIPQDAKFEFRDDRVQEFAPGRDGISVNEAQTAQIINDAVTKLTGESKAETVKAELARVPPKVSTNEVNNLGITERIGRGDSYYAHSIANRVYNVGLASARVNGALVGPGEEFSFNRFVGEISGATGYKTAYVISGGRTVLGDGGGVCQVSTTLFRAVMDAGLPITERWAHAYRVGYYEQNSDPGIDATVYSPSKDFKFTNDTPQYVLVQAINDPVNLHLVFEIYGTKDGRKATVTKPKVWGITPPPPNLYEDDPNLPAGTLKQVDWAAWGARTSFDYKVERDGQIIFEKTYTSTYRPWQNVFIRGTGGSSTP